MNEQLITIIENTRKNMIESIRKHGCGSQSTISLSQELDKLIIQYQKLVNKG